MHTTAPVYTGVHRYIYKGIHQYTPVYMDIHGYTQVYTNKTAGVI